MPTWTAMTDLTTGDLVTEAHMDAIRGNIEYLLDPNRDSAEYDASGDYGTTSATYVDVDATNAALSVTTNGGPLLIICNFWATANAQASPAGFQIDVGGTTACTLEGIVNSGAFLAVCVACIFKPAAAGAQTIKLQYKSDGTDTLTILSNGENLNMWAVEL